MSTTKIKAANQAKSGSSTKGGTKLGRGVKDRVSALGENVGTGVKQLVNTGKFIANPVKNFVPFVKNSWQNAKDSAKQFWRILFNHPEWYGHYPLQDLVGANFARRKGIAETGLKGGIPSVGALQLELMIPNEPSKAYDQAVAVMFARIRRANSGAVNYTAGDLANYIFAVRNIHALYFTARRAYATLFNFQNTDASIPATLFAGYGLDYVTFMNNAANLHADLMQWSRMIREMCPLNIDLISRTDWLFSNIFCDSDDAKASLWVFALKSITYFVAYTSATVTPSNQTIVGALSSSATGSSYSYITGLMNNMMNVFVKNDTFNIIAGDILKAYGASALFDDTTWGPTEAVDIVYDEMALTQIQNATVLTSQGSAYNAVITRSANHNDGMTTTLGITGIATSSSSSLYKDQSELFLNPFVNFYKDTISSEELISATRLKLAAPATLKSTWSSANTTCNTAAGLVNGTEIVVDGKIYYLDPSSTDYRTITAVTLGWRGVAYSVGGSMLFTRTWAAMDWAPMQVIVDVGLAAGSQEASHILWDWNNYAKCTDIEIGTYHALAALSLLYVPGQIKVTNNVETYK